MKYIIIDFIGVMSVWVVLAALFWLYCLWADRKRVTAGKILSDIKQALKVIFSISFVFLCITILLPLMLGSKIMHWKGDMVMVALVVFVVFEWGLFEIWRRHYPAWKNWAAIMLVMVFFSFSK